MQAGYAHLERAHDLRLSCRIDQIADQQIKLGQVNASQSFASLAFQCHFVTELAQLSGQTGTNVLVVLNDKDPALVVTALDHLIENFGSGEISRRPSLVWNTKGSPIALQNISEDGERDEQRQF